MDKTMIALERDLAKALLKMSGYSISISNAEEIANKVMRAIDFNNKAIAHKGISWLAKEIIDSYEIDDMEEI